MNFDFLHCRDQKAIAALKSPYALWWLIRFGNTKKTHKAHAYYTPNNIWYVAAVMKVWNKNKNKIQIQSLFTVKWVRSQSARGHYVPGEKLYSYYSRRCFISFFSFSYFAIEHHIPILHFFYQNVQIWVILNGVFPKKAIM